MSKQYLEKLAHGRSKSWKDGFIYGIEHDAYLDVQLSDKLVDQIKEIVQERG